MNTMVLLQNNGILPLEKGIKLSVTGPMAEEKAALLGSWHDGGNASDVISLADGIKRINGEENTLAHQCLSEDMCRYIKFADISVVAIGESDYMTGEGRTVQDIELSDTHVSCIKYAKEMGKRVIAVVFAGRPLAIEKILPYCDAVLWAWHGGTMCGLAAAEIIFGNFNPCAKLPVTIPRSTGQIPTHYNHQRNQFAQKWYYEQSDYVATNARSTPSFVFGYGLTYTSFEYSDFSCTTNKNAINVSVKIKNTGEYDGSEIVQCYISDIVASASRPIKELKAFEKVFLRKNEEKTVHFTLTKEDLSFYDIHGKWVFESGEFEIQVGKSSNDIAFKAIVAM